MGKGVYLYTREKTKEKILKPSECGFDPGLAAYVKNLTFREEAKWIEVEHQAKFVAYLKAKGLKIHHSIFDACGITRNNPILSQSFGKIFYDPMTSRVAYRAADGGANQGYLILFLLSCYLLQKKLERDVSSWKKKLGKLSKDKTHCEFLKKYRLSGEKHIELSIPTDFLYEKAKASANESSSKAIIVTNTTDTIAAEGSSETSQKSSDSQTKTSFWGRFTSHRKTPELEITFLEKFLETIILPNIDHVYQLVQFLNSPGISKSLQSLLKDFLPELARAVKEYEKLQKEKAAEIKLFCQENTPENLIKDARAMDLKDMNGYPDYEGLQHLKRIRKDTLNYLREALIYDVDTKPLADILAVTHQETLIHLSRAFRMSSYRWSYRDWPFAALLEIGLLDQVGTADKKSNEKTLLNASNCLEIQLNDQLTPEKVKKARKRMAFKTHPDKNPGKDPKLQNDLFDKVNKAGDMLLGYLEAKGLEGEKDKQEDALTVRITKLKQCQAALKTFNLEKEQRLPVSKLFEEEAKKLEPKDKQEQSSTTTIMEVLEQDDLQDELTIPITELKQFQQALKTFNLENEQSLTLSKLFEKMHTKLSVLITRTTTAAYALPRDFLNKEGCYVSIGSNIVSSMDKLSKILPKEGEEYAGAIIIGKTDMIPLDKVSKEIIAVVEGQLTSALRKEIYNESNINVILNILSRENYGRAPQTKALFKEMVLYTSSFVQLWEYFNKALLLECKPSTAKPKDIPEESNSKPEPPKKEKEKGKEKKKVTYTFRMPTFAESYAQYKREEARKKEEAQQEKNPAARNTSEPLSSIN